MKRLHLWLALSLTVIPLYPCVGGSSDEAAALREELRQMRERHDKEIRALEEKMDRLSGESSESVTSSIPEAAPAAAPAQQVPAWVTKGFEYHGYLRSGSGVNSKGGKMQIFKAPGADAKYRLGNEDDTYGEIALVNNFNPEIEEPYFKVQVRLAYSTKQYADWDAENDQFTMRETFVEAGRFQSAPDLKYWVGERFYRREDIHINDFYVLDTSGYGGGMEDLGVGPAKLAVAFIGGSNDKYEFNRVGQVDKKTLDVRLYDFGVPLGTGMVWLAPSRVKGGTYEDEGGTNQEYDTTSGFAAGLFHFANFGPDKYNRISVQYGRGTGSDFSPNVQDPTDNLRDSWQFRATEALVLQLGEQFSVMGTTIYQVKNNGAAENPKVTWISAGLRPIYQFTSHFSLAFEGGADHVNNEADDTSDILYKFTLAPQITINNLFFGRPVLRAYVTYATWGDEFKGQVGGDAFADETEGMNIGVQAEAWW